MSRLRLAMLGLLAVFVVSAGASASASALPMVWIKAHKELEKGVRFASKSHGGTFTLKATLAGVKVEIVCLKEGGEGWVENPVGAVNGKGFIQTSYTECSMPKPVAGNCKVQEPMTIEAVIAPFLKSGEPGVIFVRFTPEIEGTPLGEITIEGCTNAAINGTYDLNGSLAGKSVNGEEEGSFEFTTTSGSALTLGGSTATFTGRTFLEF